MSLQVKIELSEEARQTLARVREMPREILLCIAAAIDKENALAVAHIMRDYLSFPRQGPPVADGLRNQTGSYLRSLRASNATIENQTVQSAIGTNVVSKDGVSYPAVHEFGATIPGMTIVPKNKQALRFIIGGRVIFAKRVNIGERSIPARAPIRHGIEDRMNNYTSSISAQIAEFWKDGS